MYTEEYQANGFVLRNFLLKLIFVIIFIALLIWLVPKFSSPKVENKNKTDLSPIKEQIFAENMEKMQSIAVDYYTKARLPKKEKESKKLTLSDMIKKKLIVPLVDKDDQICDINKSYVKVTKMEKEYLMKINLKCSNEEDYTLVHMGPYDYCDSAVCEKEEVKVEKEKSKPKETVSFGTEKSVNKQKKSTKETLAIVGDSIPLTIDENIEEPATRIEPPVAGFIYEYQKNTGAEYTAWSKWSNWQRTDCKTTAYGCDDNNPTCIQKRQIYKRKEQIGTYDKSYITSHEEVRQTGSYEALTCANYHYILYNNEKYATTADYKIINTITNKTRKSVESWKYNGRKIYTTPPKESITTRYKLVSTDLESCGSTCKILPKYWYDEYVYTKPLAKVSSTSKTEKTPTLKVECTGKTKKIVPIYATVTVYDKAIKKEPLYGTVCYQSTKSRTVKTVGKTDRKWSNHNDDELLNNGYYYTGNSMRV